MSIFVLQIITAGSDAPKPVLSLQSRCLEPGKYAQHLEKWLTFYRLLFLIVVCIELNQAQNNGKYSFEEKNPFSFQFTWRKSIFRHNVDMFTQLNILTPLTPSQV